MTAVSRPDPSAVRAWAAAHDIELGDAPEPASTGEPGSSTVSEPAGSPRFTEYQRPAGSADRVARRLTRLRTEAAELSQLIAERQHEAGALARRVTWLEREQARLEEQNEGIRSRAAREAAENKKAAALARRVAQVLENGEVTDPFTAALTALRQHRRRRGELAGDGDPRLADLAGAIAEAAVRQAAVRQLQVRQITVNRGHGPASPEAGAVRRELAAERLAIAVLAVRGAGLDSGDVLSVVLTGELPGSRPGPPRLLTNPDWPVEG
jgi:hypothetical protein